MPRWGPDADDRLYRAAMQLILERGYDGVTVAQIAEHAGLTKRSFFRHYADKREVMFAGAADFERGVVETVRAAPADGAPADVVVAALTEGGAGLAAWGEPVRQRQRMVAASTELRERELIKMEALTAAVAAALRDRGVDSLTAVLTAQVGAAAFTTAFLRWTDEPDGDFRAIMADTVARLREAIR